MDTFAQAVSEFDSGNFGRALTLLREVATSNPSHAQAQRLIAASCQRLDRLDEAEQAARRYTDLRPDDAAGYQQLGQIHQRQHRTDDARRAFEQALQHDPLNAEAKRELQQMSWNSGSGDPATGGRGGSENVGAAPSPNSRGSAAAPSKASGSPTLFKVAVVVASLAIVAMAFLPQWLGSLGTKEVPNPPQRTVVANRSPEVAKALRPNPQNRTPMPSASSINEALPPQAPQPTGNANQQQNNSAMMNQGANAQQAGPSSQPNNAGAQASPQQGGNQQNTGPAAGPGPGQRGKGQGGGAGSGTMGCPICAGRGWFDCPGPTANSATALGTSLGMVLGRGGGQDICRSGRYTCADHRGESCELCGMDTPSGTCPSCKSSGRLVCAVCGGSKKFNPNDIMGKFGGGKSGLGDLGNLDIGKLLNRQ